MWQFLELININFTWHHLVIFYNNFWSYIWKKKAIFRADIKQNGEGKCKI